MASPSSWAASRSQLAPGDAADSDSNFPGRTSGETTGSGSRERKWDDPPEKPPPVALPTTTMILVQKKRFPARTMHEVSQIEFTRDDGLLVLGMANTTSVASSCLDPASNISAYEVSSLRPRSLRPPGYNGYMIQGAFSISQGPGPGSIAYVTYEAQRRIEVVDFATDKRRLRADLQVQAPVAYAPDGCFLAAVSRRDPSRIIIVDVSTKALVSPRIVRQIAVHTSPVTHIAITPDGTAIVSASTDGRLRMTSLQTGRTLRKAEIEARGSANLLQLSDDGDVVVSVWGTHVYLWKLKIEQMSAFHLDVVRQTEGWPLAISPDCRLLVCRTEDGVDVLDIETGSFLANFPLGAEHPLITAAAVSHSGRWITIGDLDGRVTVLEVITPTS